MREQDIKHAYPQLFEDARRWRALMDHVPEGTEPMPVYLHKGDVAVCGSPVEGVEHNCDAMGCGSASHVIWRGTEEAFRSLLACDSANRVRFQSEPLRLFAFSTTSSAHPDAVPFKATDPVDVEDHSGDPMAGPDEKVGSEPDPVDE